MQDLQSYLELMKFLLKFVPVNPEANGDFENLGVNIKMDIVETGCEGVA
jgi:hypothetical protein